MADVKANVADVMATGLSLFQFKFCDVIQNLIPHMRQMVFANILVEGWIIHPYVYSLFDQPHEVVQEGEAQELRVEIKNLLKNAKETRSNITKDEFKAIKELKQDDKRIISKVLWAPKNS